MNKSIYSIFFLLILGSDSKSQNSLDYSSSHLFSRMEIITGKIYDPINSAYAFHDRNALDIWIKTYKMTGRSFSSIDFYNFEHSLINNPQLNSGNNIKGKNKLGPFFTVKSAMLMYHDSLSYVSVNPVLYLTCGYQSGDTKGILFNNTRGLEIHGSLCNKVGFYSIVQENQTWLPQYVNNYKQSHMGVIPGAGFIKAFKSNLYNNAVDYLNSRGYITFSPVKYTTIYAGHDRHFIGDGERSFIISNFSIEFPFIKILTRYKKIQYMNLWGRLNHFEGMIVGQQPQHKYLALHHLTFNITKKFSLGLFETIIYRRGDSIHTYGPDAAYFNPVIFYRSVEHNNNSTDNEVMGINYKWLMGRKCAIYGQFILDEFLLWDILRQNGKWYNKYAIQTGLKSINFLTIPNLDLNLEINWCRPYTYTHFSKFTTYTNGGNPLAHPLGANFKEFLLKLNYQPFGKILLQSNILYYQIGLDSGNMYAGSNIFVDYHKRLFPGNPNYKNEIGQGIKNSVLFSQIILSYEWRHNTFVDFNFIYRNQISEWKQQNSSNLYFSVGFRMNMRPIPHSWLF